MKVSDDERQMIIDLESRIWQGVTDGDRDFLQAVFTEDYLEITSDGIRVEKQTIVDESPDVDAIAHWEMTNAKVQRVGEAAFLLNYRLDLQGMCREKPIEPHERWATSVWRMDSGEFRCCYFQQTPISGG